MKTITITTPSGAKRNVKISVHRLTPRGLRNHNAAVFIDGEPFFITLRLKPFLLFFTKRHYIRSGHSFTSLTKLAEYIMYHEQ